jgi:hypothetical protein
MLKPSHEEEIRYCRAVVADTLWPFPTPTRGKDAIQKWVDTGNDPDGRFANSECWVKMLVEQREDAASWCEPIDCGPYVRIEKKAKFLLGTGGPRTPQLGDVYELTRDMQVGTRLAASWLWHLGFPRDFKKGERLLPACKEMLTAEPIVSGISDGSLKLVTAWDKLGGVLDDNDP